MWYIGGEEVLYLIKVVGFPREHGKESTRGLCESGSVGDVTTVKSNGKDLKVDTPWYVIMEIKNYELDDWVLGCKRKVN